MTGFLAGALLGFPGLALASQVPASVPVLAPAHATPVAKGKPAPKAPTAKPAPGTLVDVNFASKAALMNLPGIDGPLADKIIAGRPYLSKAKLVTRKVLTLDMFQKIRSRIETGSKPPFKK